MLYNSALLIAIRLVEAWFADPVRIALSAFLVSERLKPLNHLILPYETLTTAEICSEICRSIEYHFQKPHALSGPMFLLLPIRVCLSEFQGGQREYPWLIGMLRRIADTCGFEVSWSLPDFRDLQSRQVAV
jgi:hypothetical protein